MSAELRHGQSIGLEAVLQGVALQDTVAVGGRTVANGETVQHRHSIKKMVQLGLAHLEDAGPVAHQIAVQPLR